MTRPISDLVIALADDHAVLLDDRGVPALPNRGWAGRYMNVGWSMSGDYNTLILKRTSGIYVNEDDERDLNIIAQKIGYTVTIESSSILFRQYNAWEY